MQLAHLIDELARLASLPREVEIARRLAADPVGADMRDAVASLVSGVAAEVLALPWRGALSPAAQAVLRQHARAPAWRALLARMLAGGLGANAIEPAPGGQLWLPRWLAELAAQRAGASVPFATSRWVVPTTWPVPVEQVLVGGLPQACVLAQVARCALRAPLVIDGPMMPPTWIGAGVAAAPTLDDLPLRFDVDGHAAMAYLLTAWGHPLAGIAMQLATMAARRAAHAARGGRRWTGALGHGAHLACAAHTVVLLPGWLGACLQTLGRSCPGAPASGTQATEDALVRAHDGDVIVGNGTDLHRFPVVVGALVRAAPCDWSAVATLGG